MICRARSLSHEFPLSPASPLIPHLLSLRAAETAKRGVVFSVLSLGNHCRIFERGEIWKDYIFEFGNHQESLVKFVQKLRNKLSPILYKRNPFGTKRLRSKRRNQWRMGKGA
ncbi:uncharacterized protein LOC129285925 isoform X1 [Prosopis cineraria]|uniref:uncharacterized protein LOC129285925 isoform X1 n=1 Tax=Prosopis cineraria TaxID=364024 RepID=UPI00240FE132|nr:uncharacterized protein LOC129285925 isoform X1 [Prosopis cineraria]